MGSAPIASAVMAAYNAEAYLDEAVESLLRQSFSDLELVVVDDGSPDATPDLLARWAERDERVRVVRQANAGLARSLERGCALARGRYLVRLDADDVALPDRVERQVRYLESRPHVAAVGGESIMTDADGREFAIARYPCSREEIARTLLERNVFVHSAMTIRAEAYHAVRGYRPFFRRSEDYDLWLRLAERYELANLALPVVRYRVHPEQMTAASVRDEATYALAARGAARRCRRGEPDPVDSASEATELLRELDIGERAVEREAARRAAWYAKLMTRAGYLDAADSLWSLAERSARAARSRRALSEVREAHADVLLEQGRSLAGARLMLAAAPTRPRVLLKGLSKASRSAARAGRRLAR